MEQSTESKLTIYFEEPFRVGVFEELDGKSHASKRKPKSSGYLKSNSKNARKNTEDISEVDMKLSNYRET